MKHKKTMKKQPNQMAAFTPFKTTRVEQMQAAWVEKNKARKQMIAARAVAAMEHTRLTGVETPWKMAGSAALGGSCKPKKNRAKPSKRQHVRKWKRLPKFHAWKPVKPS